MYTYLLPYSVCLRISHHHRIHSKSFTSSSTSIFMEAASTWVRRNCRMDMLDDVWKKTGLDKLNEAINIQHVNGSHLLCYGVFVLVAALYIVGRHMKNVSKSTLSLRSRSPDPEKPTDVTTYAAKRMKPTERPPGSTFKMSFRAEQKD